MSDEYLGIASFLHDDPAQGATGVDFQAHAHQRLLLAANVTISLKAPNNASAYKLFIKQAAAGGFTVTWPTTIKWQGGSIPVQTTTANKTDIYEFTYDVTNAQWFGVASQNY